MLFAFTDIIPRGNTIVYLCYIHLELKRLHHVVQPTLLHDYYRVYMVFIEFT